MLKALEKESLFPSSSLKENELYSLLISEAAEAIERFPHTIDRRLYKGIERAWINSSTNFISSRSFPFLRKIFLAQLFLQERMENALKHEGENKQLFLKLFKQPSCISVAFASTSFDTFQRDQLQNTLHSLIPGIQEVPQSFYLWHHPELPYFFCYWEVHKLRGKELSAGELRVIESSLREQLLAKEPLTPALFWPYNKEEAYRQILLLQREMNDSSDLPHLSVHFLEQSTGSLVFLIHIARPKASKESLDRALKRLPESFHQFCRFYYESKTPFPLEAGVFSIQITSTPFETCGLINLLYARRYLLKYLETVIGPFRDYNGGLFETQRQHFEEIRMRLGERIPHFDLFAEKLFYAIHPVETWLSLSLNEAEELFSIFSEMIEEKRTFSRKSETGLFTIIKTVHGLDQETTQRDAHAQLTLGGYHYFCLFESKTRPIQPPPPPRPKIKKLSLLFQEGAPPSLNPHYSSADMRCRVLNKMLFEGLMRLDAKGEPECAGAVEVKIENGGALFIFKLRSFCWSNGEKVTAAEYASSWHSALSHHVSHPEMTYIIKNARKFKEKKCEIKDVGVRALDSDTLEVELEKPDPLFLHKLAQPFFAPLFGALKEPKWFNGPYFVREQSDLGMLLEKNPYYWDQGRPYYEQISIRWLDDNATIYARFKAGEVDWIGDPLSILSFPQIKQLEQDGLLLQRQVPRLFALYFNTKHPILSCRLIRQALSLSIARDHICHSIFPYSIPSSTSGSQIEEARACFEMGLKELGLTRDTLPPLTFSFSVQTRREELASYLQKCWREILGIEVRVEGSKWNYFRSKLEKRSFEICVTIHDYQDYDSIDYLKRYEGATSWNFSDWIDPQYIEILSQIKDEGKLTDRHELIAAARKILQDEIPFAPLFQYTHLYAHKPEMKGYIFDSEGCVDFSWTYLNK